MFRKLIIMALPLLFQIIAAELSKNVPVFIVDNDRTLSKVTAPKSPFAILNKLEFRDIVRDAMRKADQVVVFVEDLLSAEDVSSRDKLGSPFYLLRQGLNEDSVKYFPSVDDPLSELQDLLPKTEINTFHLDSKTSKLPLYNSKLRHVYVFFKDDMNVSRIDLLRQHDLIMREVHYVVKKRSKGPVVAFYTGKVNPNAVLKNKPDDSPFAWKTRDGAIWCRNYKAILAIEGLSIMQKNMAVTLPPTVLGEVACTYRWNREENPTEVTVEMPLTSYTLQCRFTYNDVTWTFENCQLRPDSAVEGLLSGEGYRVDFRKTFRYQKTFQYNRPFDLRRADGNGVFVKKISVEVLNKPGQKQFSISITQQGGGGGSGLRDGGTGDGDNGDSVPDTTPSTGGTSDKGHGGGDNDDKGSDYFFTEPLLTCFFISGILISILIYGFSSLAAVHSNSRYDDPKGKPLMFAES